MQDADARGRKRPAVSESGTLTALRSQLLAHMAEVMERTQEELEQKALAEPEATLLELGLTSAAGVALKGWVLRHLEAELTTFQLLKQPLNDVVEAIDVAQRDDVGARMPALQPELPQAAS